MPEDHTPAPESPNLDHAIDELQQQAADCCFTLGVLVQLRQRAAALQTPLLEELGRLIELAARVRDLMPAPEEDRP